MTNLILTSSFKRAFKAIIKRQPNLKQKIEAKLRLLADNHYKPNSYEKRYSFYVY
ncbi:MULTISPECIES: hypothetical protein [Moorena]|uniref:Uncharacterized protein n=1 Tax=Moorena producens 3L TaxID=489825 RepID=F4XZL5_9CYAN|nr:MULTISPECIES: hypothetical protein [Moorena]EGJ30020.1 hypothetical protein LYNGBM3L_57860 [Moorena producens 3L]